jgi:hypothetical protein
MTIILVILFVSFPQPAFAHILKISGNIGSTLHIDPADDPIAKSPSSFFFELKDKNGRFKVDECICQVTIFQNGKEIFSESILQNNNSSTTVSFLYTFPEVDIYKLELAGRPRDGKLFESFKFDYDIRVDKQSLASGEDKENLPSEVGKQDTNNVTSNSWLKAHTIHLIGGIIVLGFFVFALIKQKREGVKKHKTQ